MTEAILVLVGVVGLCAFLLLFGNRLQAQDKPKENVPAVASSSQTVVKPLSRSDVEARLKKLAEGPTPKNLVTGAMHYDPFAFPPSADYVCPKCGERTHYAHVYKPENELSKLSPADRQSDRLLFMALYHVVPRIQDFRAQLKDIQGLEVSLDESSFCQRCNPGLKDPKLVLVIRYPGDPKEHRTADVTFDDLVLLSEFSRNSDKHRYDNDQEAPLKDFVPRLRELLGL